MSVSSTTVSGTLLSAKEMLDLVCTRYSVSPINLQIHCDRCETAFGGMHTLTCGTGSLGIARHNEICENSFIYPDGLSPLNQ